MSGATVIEPDRPIGGHPGRPIREAPSSDELAPRRRAGHGRTRREKRPPAGGIGPPDGAGGGRLTLATTVASAWEGLLAAGSAACPVCRGPMELEGAVGRCGDCGSRLE